MKRSLGRLSLSIAAVLGSSHAYAQDPPNYDAYFDPSVASASAPAARIAAAGPHGFAASLDERRGVPSFVWASKQQQLPPAGVAHASEAAARWYLRENARVWNVPRAVFDAAEVVKVHDTGRGGIVVTLRQSIEGIEVLHSEFKVLMTRSLQLVAISGTPRGAGAETKKSGRTFKLAPDQAIAGAFKNLYGVTLGTSSLRDTKKGKAGYQLFELTSKPALQADRLFVQPARVKKVFFPLPDRLVPAYFLELFAGKIDETDSDSYAYVIAADDGRVLFRQNLTQSDVFNYTVWAEADGTPRDGPQANFTPHPTGVADGSIAAFIPPDTIAMEGFNTNPNNAADPWLPAGATQTLGNNVDAYSDDDTPDGFSTGDLRATITSLNTFDRVYDTSLQPLANVNQTMASTTQLFYDNNWLHDWWYDSGFDEAAGNAQADNFGRGGLDGDVLIAQAQDGAVFGQRNNANMSTPRDGLSPRMQMYLFTLANRTLTVQPGNQSLLSNTAPFGDQDYSFTAELALGQDGVASIDNACEPLVSNVVGKVALVNRGTCTFIAKALNVQAAGAVGMILANNQPNFQPPGMSGADPSLVMPVVSVTKEDGDALRAQLQAGPLSVTMTRSPGIERDGTIDNNIVAHEWGHYIHHRLVQCGLQQCGGMSEGWGDFSALYMSIREGDNLDGTFGMGGYASGNDGPNSGYFGTRRAPYSTDFNKNAFTFRHVSDGVAIPANHPLGSGGSTNSEVHNVGEIWASMLFEGYIALLKESEGANPRYTFQQARRLMADYIVAGMQMAPFEPSITQQRDAVLAAAYASEPLDMLLLAEGFAKRGLGTCALAPPIESTNLVGAVESFGAQSNVAYVGMEFDDSVASCDMDGVLDGKETGQVTVTVLNSGVAPLTNTTATVSSLIPGVVFPNGPTVNFGSIEPFATGTATIDIALDASVTQIGFLDLKVDITDPAACVLTTSDSIVRRINFDDLATVASFDTVESNLLAWTAAQADGDDVWAREQDGSENHVWHGINYFSTSDTALESPDLVVSNIDPFILTMEHRHSFEWEPTISWDGAVMEVSEDGGATWVDVSAFASPGYTGVITDLGGNPLENRAAFVGTNASWPARETLTVDFGAALAGKTVRLRYRIGTDGYVGEFGWEIDNISFLGITNAPFPGIVNDGSTCEGLPVADAGPDQTVQGGNEVTLDASASSDPDGDPLTFQWTQIAGPAVSLTDLGAASPMFTAPSLEADTTLTFKVHVSDGVGAASDAVSILVEASAGAGGAGGGGGMGQGGAGAQGGEGPGSTSSSNAVGAGGSRPGPEEDDGCGCSVVGDGEPQPRSIAALLAAAALLIQRRRRGSKRSAS